MNDTLAKAYRDSQREQFTRAEAAEKRVQDLEARIELKDALISNVIANVAALRPPVMDTWYQDRILQVLREALAAGRGDSTKERTP